MNVQKKHKGPWNRLIYSVRFYETLSLCWKSLYNEWLKHDISLVTIGQVPVNMNCRNDYTYLQGASFVRILTCCNYHQCLFSAHVMKELKNFVDVTTCTYWHVSSVSRNLSILTKFFAFGKFAHEIAVYLRNAHFATLGLLLHRGSRSFEFLLNYVQYLSSFYVEGNFALFAFHSALKLCFTLLALFSLFVDQQ